MRRNVVALAALVVGATLSDLASAGELTQLYRTAQPRGLAMTLQAGRPAKVPRIALHFEYKKLKPFVVSYGGVLPVTDKEIKLTPYTSGLAAGYKSEDPAFEITMSQFCPGALVRTEADALGLFIGLTAKEGRRPASHLPQFLAYSADGKVAVRRAAGEIDLAGMDAPWLLVWWADKAPVYPIQLGANLNQNVLWTIEKPYDYPLLIIFQSRPKALQVGEDRWTVRFDGHAGAVVLMPLYGQLNPEPVKTDKTTKGPWWDPGPHPVYEAATLKWSDGPPEAVVAAIREWAGRMRRIPTSVAETFEVADEGVNVTETFRYLDVDDAWKTPKKPWAILPPIFGLAKRMGGPVEVREKAKDFAWLGGFGTLTVVDRAESLTFKVKIPELKRFLWEMDRPVVAPKDLDDPKYRAALVILREEIDKVLDAGQQMAPFRNNPTRYGMNFHWGNPAEAIVTLCWALPWLEADQAEKLKTYIKREFQQCDPLKISFAAVNEGVRREFYPWDPEGRLAKYSRVDHERNPHNLYAAWLYVRDVAGKEAAEELWPKAKEFFDKELADARFAWDAGESTKQLRYRKFHDPCANLNARLNGYLAYTRFARLAGDAEAEKLGTCLLARGLAVKYAQAYYHQFLARNRLREGLDKPWPAGVFTGNKDFKGYFVAGHTPRGMDFHKMFRGTDAPYVFFLDLTPEVGQFLHDYCKDPVKACVGYVMWWNPGMWSNKGDRLFPQGEYFIIEPWIPWVNFLALATAVQMEPGELVHHLGETRAKLGDLYYIQRLSMCLRAYARSGN